MSWYHSVFRLACQKIQNLNQSEIGIWRCEKCSGSAQQRNSTSTQENLKHSNKNITNTENIGESEEKLEEIKDKILNFEIKPNSELEALNLAAELGNALLKENNSLKEEIKKITENNFEITQFISSRERGTSCLESRLEIKVEELEKENLQNERSPVGFS